jgi:hypothetical protein
MGRRDVPFPAGRWSRLALALSLFAVPALPAQGPPAGQTRLEVRGTVVDDKGRPVPGASVSGDAVVTSSQGGRSYATSGPVRARPTDAKGAFTLEVYGARGGTVVLALRARSGDAFTAGPVELRGETLGKPVTLKVSRANARALSVRALDEEGKPVSGAAVAAEHQPRAPAPFRGTPGPVDLPEKAARATDTAGRLETPRCLAPDGSYRLEVKAEGFLPERTAWKDVPRAGAVAFGDVVLKRLRPVTGRVRDRQGKPVAGARVFRADGRQHAEATTDAEGRFTLKTAFSPPGFLFVEKAGFRFHGQRCDRPEKFEVTLTRRDEPAKQRLTTLPPALPRAERKALAARLLEPSLGDVLKKGTDDARLRPLKALAKLDAGRLLEELQKRPYKDVWRDGYVRRAAVEGLLAESPEEARTVADSIKDPGFRSMTYLDLYDALPAGKKAEKLALLNQAVVHSRAIKGNDHRIIQLAWVAKRYWALGEKARATKLLREGQAVAKELPTAAWAGYARGAFAEDLGLIDVPGALALMTDLKDPFEYARHHGNLAHKLGGINPAEAERVLDLIGKRDSGPGGSQRDRYAVRVCHRMAAVDLPRARKIAAGIKDAHERARAHGVMAQALARSRPKEALKLLDEAFAVLAKHVASGNDRFNSLWSASVVAGLLLPAAEQIDPTLVPEFFWRALSLRGRPQDRGNEDATGLQAAEGGALALVLARYDRGVALALVEESAQRRQQDSFRRPHYLQAAALADPRRAVALVGQMDGQGKDSARDAVVDLLLAEGEAVWRAVHRAVAQWHVDEEDL